MQGEGLGADGPRRRALTTRDPTGRNGGAPGFRRCLARPGLCVHRQLDVLALSGSGSASLTRTRSPHDPRVGRRCGSHSDRSQTPLSPASPQEHSLAGRSSQPRAAGPGLGDPTPSISTMKEDLETLLALERANIIANYTQARPAGSPRDPWEDAELSLCRLTDHHGFLQEKEMPGPSPHEAKQLRQETRRADKWVKMLRNWEHYWVSEKMHRRVYKRVPLQVWGQVWTLLLDIEKVKSTNQGVYEKMKEQAQLFSRDIRQIDLDVNRTFRNHVMFRDHYGVR
ncbi:USP6 N-terminal-like protein isoform X3 [Phoca vitulina]|nr:USP6 N-terminal-like protein isoform X3 [Phoca vitulina]